MIRDLLSESRFNNTLWELKGELDTYLKRGKNDRSSGKV